MKSKCTLDNYQEYIVFLYLYLANSDFSVHLKEINTIYSKMEALFPHHNDIDKLYNKVKRQFDSAEEEEMDHIIEENFLLYKEELSNTDKLIADFYDIITSDGIIQDYEIEAFEKIKQLMTKAD